MTNETEIYWCRKCEVETLTANPICSKCGKKMQTQSTVKGLGKFLIAIGAILMLISGLGIALTIRQMFFAKFVMAFLALPMWGATASAGIAYIVGGLRQSKTGRTSKLLSWLYFGLMFLIIFFVGLFSVVKG